MTCFECLSKLQETQILLPNILCKKITYLKDLVLDIDVICEGHSATLTQSSSSGAARLDKKFARSLTFKNSFY